jgi:arsenate reductase (thioredoxin)
MDDTILFLCPHGAAKSVMAAAYFNHQARAKGLTPEATCAGTEPDPVVMPAVVALLNEEGIALPVTQPRMVTGELITYAQRTISLGCRYEDLPTAPTRWEQWSDIPLPSKDLPAAWHSIRHHVDELIGRYMRSRLFDEKGNPIHMF